jgi:hypothetical protein
VVGHRPPRVVGWRGLNVSHVAGVSSQVARFQSLNEGIALDACPASRID